MPLWQAAFCPHTHHPSKHGRAVAKRTSTEGRGNKMAWFFILFSDIFEVAWPFLLKWSVSLSGWAPLLVAIIVAVPVNFLLAEAVKQLPAATVYATFTGIATAGTAIIGVAFFGESANPGRVFSLALIVAGLIGLRVFSATAE